MESEACVALIARKEWVEIEKITWNDTSGSTIKFSREGHNCQRISYIFYRRLEYSVEYQGSGVWIIVGVSSRLWSGWEVLILAMVQSSELLHTFPKPEKQKNTSTIYTQYPNSLQYWWLPYLNADRGSFTNNLRYQLMIPNDLSHGMIGFVEFGTLSSGHTLFMNYAEWQWNRRVRRFSREKDKSRLFKNSLGFWTYKEVITYR